MKQTDSQQILELLTRLTEELVGPVKARPRAKRKEPLSDSVDQLDRKIGTSRRNLPIAVQLDALDRKVEHRFDAVDRRIDATGEHVVDLMPRVHEEIPKRVVDLEVPAPGSKGNGGSGTGGAGVPLAS